MIEGGVRRTPHLYRIVGIDEIVEKLPLQVEELVERKVGLLCRSSGRCGFCRTGDILTSHIMVGVRI